MSGPYGPNETPGPGEGHSSDPTQQWSGQQQPGQSGPPQWGGQPPQQPQWGGQPAPQQPQPEQWAQPQQPQAPQQPQWGQQSQPSWPQQPPAQSQPWEPTQQQWGQPPQPSQQQWGQPPQGQQQWSPQPDQSGQQWGSPQEPQLTVTPAKKSRKGLIFGGIGALVVIVVAVVLAFVFLGSDKLDNKAVQDGVQKVLKDSYGIDDVEGVSCPSGQKVEVGATFDCTLKVGGEAKKVTVKITKDDGTYEVGRPN
ncbi:DUF4333 domain-containing protein [Nocardia nova]|uniref:DUF4333 domain-containing protein n=1 Tax=Nocardia nova TaxID=37330 RepID=UPI0033E1F0DA